MLGTVVSGNWNAAVTKADLRQGLTNGEGSYTTTLLFGRVLFTVPPFQKKTGMLQKWLLSLSQGLKETRKECSRWREQHTVWQEGQLCRKVTRLEVHSVQDVENPVVLNLDSGAEGM